MIAATQLAMLTTRTAGELTHMIRDAGYKRDSFIGVKFLGMTNGNQFCYHASYIQHDMVCGTKVFITVDPTTGKATADY